jgi:gluconate 2-dehydrogenase gamma chain
MLDDNSSRRAFLRILSTAIGSTWLTLEWSSVLAAAHDAHTSTRAPAPYTKFLTDAESAEVTAITAQIIPTDTTPGAREAGIPEFIDRALATFFERLAPTFRSQLTEFRAACNARHPTAPSFAALSSEQQVEFLLSIERSPFFNSIRLLTLIGMFAMPEYGGNRGGIGWMLLGFEDRHMFAPPFGDYDRDYPGFEIQGFQIQTEAEA